MRNVECTIIRYGINLSFIILMRPSPTPTTIERVLNDHDFIVSKTDTKGIIKYGNRIFIAMSGYSEAELLGANHNIIRHPDMPRCIFQLLWDTLEQQHEVFAYVKNLCKDGSFYWVLANITPSFDANGRVVGYFSVRRKAQPSAIATISEIYARLLAEERRVESGQAARRKESIAASSALLREFLHSKNMTYEQYILSI